MGFWDDFDLAWDENDIFLGIWHGISPDLAWDYHDDVFLDGIWRWDFG